MSNEKTKASKKQKQHTTKEAVPGETAPGLDSARHATTQRHSHQAEVLRKGVFPALMASALNLDKFFDTAAYKIYLENVLRDMGEPTDPIERMLVEQLCLAHFRVAQLQADAGSAKGLVAIQLLNSVAGRMLGEMRLTALSLQTYRTGTAKPKARPQAPVKLFKEA